MPYIVVLVVFPLMAYGAVTYITARNGSSSTSSSGTTPSGDGTSTTSPTGTAPPQETPTVAPTQAPDTTTSVVYYPSPEDLTTAQLVASTLGVTKVEENADQAGKGANSQIVVVLAEDYKATP